MNANGQSKSINKHDERESAGNGAHRVREQPPTLKSRANFVVGGIVAAVVVVSLAFMAGGGFLGGSADTDALRAIVHDGDGNAVELPLGENTTLEVSTELGSNTVVVEGGEVYVSEADCDNLDCVHQGRISSPGKQIICLPHKMWIEVVKDSDASGQMDVSAAEESAGSSEAYDSVSR